MNGLELGYSPHRRERRQGTAGHAWTLGAAVTTAVLGVIVLAAPALAGSKDVEIRRHPGFIDGSAFAALAGEDSELVEVNIGPSLLKAIARGAKQDHEAAAVLSGLLNVSAYIVELDGADAVSRATKMIGDIVQTLDRSGWERLVKVRDRGELVNVYIRNSDELVDGLVVLVFDRNENQVVFANLVGSIDLAKIGDLDGALDIPGLDALGDVDTGKHVPPPATPPPSKSGANKSDKSSSPKPDGDKSRGDEMGDQP